MLLTIWTKTEGNQIYKAELHWGGGGAVGHHIIYYLQLCLAFVLLEKSQPAKVSNNMVEIGLPLMTINGLY